MSKIEKVAEYVGPICGVRLKLGGVVGLQAVLNAEGKALDMYGVPAEVVLDIPYREMSRDLIKSLEADLGEFTDMAVAEIHKLSVLRALKEAIA